MAVVCVHNSNRHFDSPLFYLLRKKKCFIYHQTEGVYKVHSLFYNSLCVKKKIPVIVQSVSHRVFQNTLYCKPQSKDPVWEFTESDTVI